MRSRQHAELLLRKAQQDEFTLDKLLPDPASPDEVIGFHAQQAVEKMLKAVLAARSVNYRRTHDLTELLDVLREHNIPYPERLEEIRHLTPFAAAFRYDPLPEDPEQSFDRSWARDCVRSVRKWAESTVNER